MTEQLLAKRVPMPARRISTAILSLLLALLAILPLRAQGPGPKGGPFIPLSLIHI